MHEERELAVIEKLGRPNPEATPKCRWIRARAISPCLTRSHLRPPRHSTITDRITRCRRQRCQRQLLPPYLPYDTPVTCARCHKQSHAVRCGTAVLRRPLPWPGVSEVFRVVMRWECWQDEGIFAWILFLMKPFGRRRYYHHLL